MVGLQVGGLIGDQRVGRGVALVEAVAGELVDLLEDLLGLGLGHAARDRALDEVLALGLHLRADLLAHGPAQQVGGAERIAGQLLGDLHDLLLVDHDPEGLLQDAFQRRIEVIDRLLVVLARDEARDVVHGPRAKQRDDGDDVLEAVRLEALEHVAHARGLQLEHPHRVAAAEHGVGSRVVQRDPRQIQRGAARGDQLAGARQHRKGL